MNKRPNLTLIWRMNKMRDLLRAGVAVAALMGMAMLSGAAPVAVAQTQTKLGTAEGQVQELIVHLGKATVVNLPAEAREVLVSNPGITQAILRTASQTVLLGQNIGQTNVIFFDGAGNRFLTLELRVEHDVTLLQNALAQHFPRTNVKVSSVLGKIVLTGMVRSSAEAATIAQFAQGYVESSGAGGGGGAASEAITANPNAAGSSTGADVINRLAVMEEDQVMIKVRVAEVNRSVTKSLGIDWDARFGDARNAARGIMTGGTLDTLLNFTEAGGLSAPKQGSFLVNALEKHTLLRLLAEPSLTAVSGESASMLAGGEFPVVVGSSTDDQGRVTLDYEFREVGVSLDFTPVVLGEGRISLKIATEVSEFTDEESIELAGGVIRGISLRRASTTVELPSGGTMVIAGLLSSTNERGSTGVPGMRNVPVLGALFRSESFLNDETELVILATPYVVRHGQESDFRLPTDGFAPSSDIDMYLFGKLTSTYGGNSSAAASAPPAAPVGFILE